uniref:Ribosome recycling factor domain-containing protein n=2 Tax=Rhodosorus marinus TaxID=101924 RepID=A0A7S2ZSF2_9RHOD|mmetsp:Transcript_30136/g.115642  ORF Transcript_30136/g.115642 Transcript_30136/m.115642 type:complete len:224 (+) Transcript_30136:142-813(+)
MAFVSTFSTSLRPAGGSSTCESRPLNRASQRKMIRIFMAQDEQLKRAEDRMKKTVETVKSNFNTVRTGRANASMLDRVVVPYYEVDTPLNQLASISIPSATTIQIDPYDKSVLGDIERSLMEADLGMNPNSDGSVIRLIVPPLTQERRKEFVKSVKAIAENGRVAVRNIRRDAIDKYKKAEKDGDMSKDESKTNQDAAQKLTDKYVKTIDSLASEKEKDILTV